jgi:uncharacterized protein with LGFP repeats
MRRSIACSVKKSVLYVAVALCAVATAAGTASADPIQDKYAALGGSSGPLGPPTSGYFRTQDGKARYQRFVNGAIYDYSIANVNLPAVAVWGDIYRKWNQLGRQQSPLGYPVSDETGCADGRGRFSRFQNGLIMWTPQTGANAVWGDIGRKYVEAGMERGYGYPVTDELPTPDGRGRYNHFEHGRSIYWTPQTGAHLIYGAIRELWAAMGWERSWLGYPRSDEMAVSGGGRINYFEHGVIFWTPQDGAKAFR